MDLYRVSSKGITKLDVKKETRCGWRERNGGFINRSELKKYSRYTGGNWFYTTNKCEAVDWAKTINKQMRSDMTRLEESIKENE